MYAILQMQNLMLELNLKLQSRKDFAKIIPNGSTAIPLTTFDALYNGINQFFAWVKFQTEMIYS